jgi:hypothetical protein
MVSRALRAMTIHALGPRFRGDDGFLNQLVKVLSFVPVRTAHNFKQLTGISNNENIRLARALVRVALLRN